MKKIIALLLLLGSLPACGSSPPPAAEEPAGRVPMTDLQPAAPSADGALQGTTTFAQAAPEQFLYTVEIQTLADSTLAEDGTELVRRTYRMPVLSVTLADGTELTEAATPEQEAALAAAETFNSRFRDWAAADGLEEIAQWAEEERAFRAESGAAWTPYVLEMDSTVYQTAELLSVSATYYANTGGAHPNTVLMAWNFDLTAGQFLTPEQLAADGEAFSGAVQAELLRQCLETAAEYGVAPEEFFWSNYLDILADWSSYAVCVDEAGLTVGVSPYELAAYAAGPQEYLLPYEMLSDYFSAHGAAMLGLEPAEK